MSKHKIFIDGEHGTTGLQIRERLDKRADLALISLGDDVRKNADARKEALFSADFAILCLPDQAAREAVELADGSRVRIIDASTAHRVSPGWVYGFPEMAPDQKQKIATAKYVTNPGCYPTGAIALLKPLVANALIPADFPVTINAISGYSGGGKAMISAFEDPNSPNATANAFTLYGLGFDHKHLPEMQANMGLAQPPHFVPSVGKFAQGMLISVPVPLWALPNNPSGADMHAALSAYYDAPGDVTVVSPVICKEIAKAGVLGELALEPQGLNGTNKLNLFVFANEASGQALLVAQLDNLGKGASGQAVQCLDIMRGI